MATKIKLMRLGKMRAPYYRVVVADARTKRDGRSIETIGKYHPKEDPSFIEINSERAQYWLSVGAQPTEAVAAIFRVTGDWQKFKGEPAPPPMKVAAPRADKRAAFEAAHSAGTAADDKPATTAKKTAAKKATAKPAADAPAAASGAPDKPATAKKAAADKPAADKPAADKPAADKPAADKPAADKPAADKPAADKVTADESDSATLAAEGAAAPAAQDVAPPAEPEA